VVLASAHSVPSILPEYILEQCNEQHRATINTTDNTVVLKAFHHHHHHVPEGLGVFPVP